MKIKHTPISDLRVSFRPIRNITEKGFHNVEGIIELFPHRVLIDILTNETVYTRCCVCGDLFRISSKYVWVYFNSFAKFLETNLDISLKSFEFVKGDYLVFTPEEDYFYCSEDCKNVRMMIG